MSSSSLSSVVTTTTRLGHRMHVHQVDYIGRAILTRGIYDEQNLNLMRPILECIEPRTILDIGANIGNHSLAWSGLCRRLYAFEPGGKAYDLLHRNFSENSLAHLHALNFGLSDSETSLPLYVNTQGNLGASSLHNRSESDTAEVVQLRRGDDYLEEQGVHDVDFIKIDVEGHERQAFLGLRSTLDQCRPLVQVEWDAISSQRGWLADADLVRDIFPDYDVYAFIWNTNRAYWSNKSMGVVRYAFKRVLTRNKHRVLTRFDPVSHKTRVNDLLLVPREKTSSLVNAELFA